MPASADMGMVEVISWVAAGVAIIAVAVAIWQLVVARRRAQNAAQQLERANQLSATVKANADRAAESVRNAQGHARWAWEQVKLASDELEEARREHRASARVEQWEWAYALTMTARELVETSQELIRIAMDARVAPHYRQAADRNYRQTCQRWQDSMVKALARTSPTLEVQQQVLTFSCVHQRLHGHIDVLLRAAETGTLAGDEPVTRQVLGLRQELANAHRQLQRTVSTSLAASDEETEDAQPTRQITSSSQDKTAQ